MIKAKRPVKTNGRRNRAAGKQWELEIIRTLKERNLYPLCVSTRSESRSLDGCGIDIMNKNEGLNGLMSDSIQAKTESRTVPYPKLLHRIREAGRMHPVVFHRQTSKANSKFMERDRFAICYLDTYLDGIAARIMVSKLKAHLAHMPDEIRNKITNDMSKLGL